MQDEEITLSRKEVDRLAVARQLDERLLTQADAARRFDVSVRQVKRIFRRYRAQGAAGVVLRASLLPPESATLEAVSNEFGVSNPTLERWRAQAMDSLNDTDSEAVSREQVRADRKRIRTLERELKHKEKALAETTALLVLSKKLSAIFREGRDE